MDKASLIRRVTAALKSSFIPVTVVALLLGGIAVMVSNALAPRVDSTSTASQGRIIPVEATPGATLGIDRERAELGTMSLDETRSADFILTNGGTEPVEISQVGTSCMCTFARIAIGGQTSPDFNMAMHNSEEANSWKGVIDPGRTATVTVIYQPSLMPVEGSVTRNVKFATNDPQNQTVELGIHATVTGGASG